MKTFLLIFTALTLSLAASAQQIAESFVSDSLTDTQNDTIEMLNDFWFNGYGIIYITVDTVEGTASATLHIDGSIDGERWYEVSFWNPNDEDMAGPFFGAPPEIDGTSLHAVLFPFSVTDQNDTGSFDQWAPVGTAPFRYLRLRVEQEGSGTSIYSGTIYYER